MSSVTDRSLKEYFPCSFKLIVGVYWLMCMIGHSSPLIFPFHGWRTQPFCLLLNCSCRLTFLLQMTEGKTRWDINSFILLPAFPDRPLILVQFDEFKCLSHLAPKASAQPERSIYSGVPMWDPCWIIRWHQGFACAPALLVCVCVRERESVCVCVCVSIYLGVNSSSSLINEGACGALINDLTCLVPPYDFMHEGVSAHQSAHVTKRLRSAAHPGDAQARPHTHTHTHTHTHAFLYWTK